MTAVYAIGQAIRLHAWPAVALAPVNDYGNAWRLLAAGAILRAGLLVAPVAVPAGLAIGGLLWAWRIYAITTGLAGITASAPIEFDTRQWRRQVRAARGRAAAPGTVPLLTRGGQVVIGPVIRAIRHKWRPILEGTREQTVAEAQAMALTELVAHTATDPDSEWRAILLAADDYSAVSRRVPISNLYERGRSLGLGVQVSAQSWQGLGRDDDERYRIAATADGGIWLMSTPHPQPVVELAGTRRVLESAHKLVGATWGGKAPPGLSTPGSLTPT